MHIQIVKASKQVAGGLVGHPIPIGRVTLFIASHTLNVVVSLPAASGHSGFNIQC